MLGSNFVRSPNTLCYSPSGRRPLANKEAGPPECGTMTVCWPQRTRQLPCRCRAQLWRLTGDQARLQVAGTRGRYTYASAGQSESAEATALAQGPIVLMACQPGIAGIYSEALFHDLATPVIDHSGNRCERNPSDGGEPMSGQEAVGLRGCGEERHICAF